MHACIGTVARCWSRANDRQGSSVPKKCVRARARKDGPNRRRKARDRPELARSSVFVSLQITWVGLDEQQEETRGTYALGFVGKYEDTVLERRVRQQAPICMSACRGWGRDYGGWNWKKRAVRASVREKKKKRLVGIRAWLA
jgi:hypothetical protein